MLKRILVLLGETRASVVARQYAFRLARAEHTQLVGIAGIDVEYIETPMLGGIGMSAYKAHMEQELRAQAKETCQRLRLIYENECKANGVRFDWLDFDGDPVRALQLAAESSDAVVMGHDTAFRGKVQDRLPDMLVELSGTTPRPLIVCGDDDHEGGDVMVAYDGSLPAMRAVQLFALLGIRTKCRVRLIAIGNDKSSVEHLPGAAATYLSDRGYETEVIPVVTRRNPADVLKSEVLNHKISTLVMGVYGHTGLRERLFGSTTTRLLEAPPCALFVYH